MRRFQLAVLAGVFLISSFASAQEAGTRVRTGPDLQKLLWDVNQQWLCAGPYQKPYKECVRFRSKYWVDQFFEIGRTGIALDKVQMVATQSAVDNPMGIGPHPDALELRAVYGDFAIGVDYTAFTTVGPDGQPTFTSSARVLRLFVKENGEWRPAGAALVPVVMPPGSVPIVPAPPVHSTNPLEVTPDWAKTETDLAAMDQKMVDAAMNKKVADLKQLLNDGWIQITGWDPTETIDKPTFLKMSASVNRAPVEAIVADEFKLRAMYPNVGLATDRRTRTWTNGHGQPVKTEYRSLLVFVKPNGEWKFAAIAVVPIATPK
jgi:ketosteroid isomerase-like protein